jgi:hypothetical protein
MYVYWVLTSERRTAAIRYGKENNVVRKKYKNQTGRLFFVKVYVYS